MSRTILLVGGGTGGHIFPLHPLAQKLLAEGNSVHLIVNDAELDRKVIADKFSDLESLKVHYLKTYKIDYHLSLRNLVAPFKILGSFFRTQKLIKKTNPDTVFFKGGFVGFPVLIALKYFISKRWWERSKTRNSRQEENFADKRTLLVRVREYFSHNKKVRRFSSFPRIYLHDSDISAGKLTQLIGKNADHIFTNFGANATPLFYWPNNLKIQKSQNHKPKILVFGGSQGARFINNLIIQHVSTLTKNYQVTLVVGSKNRYDFKYPDLEIHNFMPQDDLIKAMIEADLVICRSGASMFQVLAAQTKCIAIPLPTSARNHQHHNAQYFADKGLCYLLSQNAKTNEKILSTIKEILNDKRLSKKLEEYKGLPQTDKIIEVITK